MRAGRLDKRISIDRRVEDTDDAGDPVVSWIAFAVDLPAEVIQAAGRERLKAHGETALADAVFRIRWLAGVETSMRIRWDGDEYDIAAIKKLGRRRGLEITATAVVA
jgi:SPP1 family predicted phage head-tail adaptor|tara:strand:- start:595 stop:915 length:321 start_codon:yes stop_codon:yes gene_type:complete